MIDSVKELLKQPYWIITLVLGVFLIVFPSVTIDKEYRWITHEPSTWVPVIIGIALLVLSVSSFGYTLLSNSKKDSNLGTGLDLTRVKENNGVLWTTVGGCEIRVVEGRLEDYLVDPEVAIALPCNEYFDDRCVEDTRSALGAYVNRVFEGQVDQFVSLMKSECRKTLGEGVEHQKTENERAESFGVGRCVLLTKPLGKSVSVALVSTTTQRADTGLSGRLSYLFDGTRELVTRVADARLREVVMPVLAGGHAGIDPPLALVGLLLAVAEHARYRPGGRRLKRVTIVVFKPDPDRPAEVDNIVTRRALALIGSSD
jgi:hypothetical protein